MEIYGYVLLATIIASMFLHWITESDRLLIVGVGFSVVLGVLTWTLLSHGEQNLSSQVSLLFWTGIILLIGFFTFETMIHKK